MNTSARPAPAPPAPASALCWRRWTAQRRLFLALAVSWQIEGPLAAKPQVLAPNIQPDAVESTRQTQEVRKLTELDGSDAESLRSFNAQLQEELLVMAHQLQEYSEGPGHAMKKIDQWFVHHGKEELDLWDRHDIRDFLIQEDEAHMGEHMFIDGVTGSDFWGIFEEYIAAGDSLAAKYGLDNKTRWIDLRLDLWNRLVSNNNKPLDKELKDEFPLCARWYCESFALEKTVGLEWVVFPPQLPFPNPIWTFTCSPISNTPMDDEDEVTSEDEQVLERVDGPFRWAMRKFLAAVKGWMKNTVAEAVKTGLKCAACGTCLAMNAIWKRLKEAMEWLKERAMAWKDWLTTARSDAVTKKQLKYLEAAFMQRISHVFSSGDQSRAWADVGGGPGASDSQSSCDTDPTSDTQQSSNASSVLDVDLSADALDRRIARLFEVYHAVEGRVAEMMDTAVDRWNDHMHLSFAPRQGGEVRGAMPPRASGRGMQPVPQQVSTPLSSFLQRSSVRPPVYARFASKECMDLITENGDLKKYRDAYMWALNIEFPNMGTAVDHLMTGSIGAAIKELISPEFLIMVIPRKKDYYECIEAAEELKVSSALYCAPETLGQCTMSMTHRLYMEAVKAQWPPLEKVNLWWRTATSRDLKKPISQTCLKESVKHMLNRRFKEELKSKKEKIKKEKALAKKCDKVDRNQMSDREIAECNAWEAKSTMAEDEPDAAAAAAQAYDECKIVHQQVERMDNEDGTGVSSTKIWRGTVEAWVEHEVETHAHDGDFDENELYIHASNSPPDIQPLVSMFCDSLLSCGNDEDEGREWEDYLETFVQGETGSPEQAREKRLEIHKHWEQKVSSGDWDREFEDEDKKAIEELGEVFEGKIAPKMTFPVGRQRSPFVGPSVFMPVLVEMWSAGIDFPHEELFNPPLINQGLFHSTNHKYFWVEPHPEESCTEMHTTPECKSVCTDKKCPLVFTAGEGLKADGASCQGDDTRACCQPSVMDACTECLQNNWEIAKIVDCSAQAEFYSRSHTLQSHGFALLNVFFANRASSVVHYAHKKGIKSSVRQVRVKFVRGMNHKEDFPDFQKRRLHESLMATIEDSGRCPCMCQTMRKYVKELPCSNIISPLLPPSAPEHSWCAPTDFEAGVLCCTTSKLGLMPLLDRWRTLAQNVKGVDYDAEYRLAEEFTRYFAYEPPGEYEDKGKFCGTIKDMDICPEEVADRVVHGLGLRTPGDGEFEEVRRWLEMQTINHQETFIAQAEDEIADAQSQIAMLTAWNDSDASALEEKKSHIAAAEEKIEKQSQKKEEAHRRKGFLQLLSELDARHEADLGIALSSDGSLNFPSQCDYVCGTLPAVSRTPISKSSETDYLKTVPPGFCVGSCKWAIWRPSDEHRRVLYERRSLKDQYYWCKVAHCAGASISPNLDRMSEAEAMSRKSEDCSLRSPGLQGQGCGVTCEPDGDKCIPTCNPAVPVEKNKIWPCGSKCTPDLGNHRCVPRIDPFRLWLRRQGDWHLQRTALKEIGALTSGIFKTQFDACIAETVAGS